jgi:hypothetical protein
MRLPWQCPLLFALLAAQTAFAAVTVDKKVDCDKGDSITAAATDLAVDKIYVLHVSGTCNENVVIDNFEGITLTVLGDPSATIQGQLANGPGVPAFLVSNSRRVKLVHLTVHTSGGTNPNDNPVGIAFNLCRGCEVLDTPIQTSRVGVNLTNSQAVVSNVTVVGSTPGSIGMSILSDSNANVLNLNATGPGSGGVGLLVDQGSRVRLSVILGANPPSTSSISGYSVGIQVRGGGLLEAQTQCTPSGGCIEVTDNFLSGVEINSGQAVFIGVNVTDSRRGIVVQNAGTLSYMGPASVNANTGAGPTSVGILVTHNSHALISGPNAMQGGTTNITGNTGRGVAVASNSSVQFGGPMGSVNVTGNSIGLNGGFNIACDGSSLITGTSMLATNPATISCVDQKTDFLPLP